MPLNFRDLLASSKTGTGASQPDTDRHHVTGIARFLRLLEMCLRQEHPAPGPVWPGAGSLCACRRNLDLVRVRQSKHKDARSRDHRQADAQLQTMATLRYGRSGRQQAVDSKKPESIRARLRKWEEENPSEAEAMLTDHAQSGELSNNFTRPQNVSMAQFDGGSFDGDELGELRSSDTQLQPGDMVEMRYTPLAAYPAHPLAARRWS